MPQILECIGRRTIAKSPPFGAGESHHLSVQGQHPSSKPYLSALVPDQLPICGRLLQVNGMTSQIKTDTPPVAKPIPASASIKAEPVPQAVKSEEGKEFLYATKVYTWCTYTCCCRASYIPGLTCIGNSLQTCLVLILRQSYRLPS